MNVLKITDQSDGSAIVELEMTEKEKDMLIEYGFNSMLKNVIERMEDETDICTTVSDS